MPTEAFESADDAARPAVGRCTDADRPERGPRPVRLASWLHPGGIDGGSDDDDHRDALPATEGEVWDPRPWIARMRTEHPGRTVAVVYDEPTGPTADAGRRSRPPKWRDRLEAVVACVRSGSERLAIGSSDGSLAAIRERIEATLTGLSPSIPDARVADAVLMVDELASNAVEHADGGLTVDLAVAGDGLIVAVSDPHPERLPVLGRPPVLQPSGRGLLVVDALSTRWGTIIDPRSKSVWAEIAWPG